MDELWHAAILDTQLYANLQDALGLVLHHRPSGASEKESEHREKRLSVMRAIYKACFSTDPLGCVLPQVSCQKPARSFRDPIAVFVRTPSGKSLTIIVERQANVEDMKSVIQNMEGIPVDQQRLMMAGRRLGYGTILGDNGIGNGSTLDLFPEQYGC